MTKQAYEPAEITVILLDGGDVITASSGTESSVVGEEGIWSW